MFEPVAAAVVVGSTVLFFLLAVHGYDPLFWRHGSPEIQVLRIGSFAWYDGD